MKFVYLHRVSVKEVHASPATPLHIAPGPHACQGRPAHLLLLSWECHVEVRRLARSVSAEQVAEELPNALTDELMRHAQRRV